MRANYFIALCWVLMTILLSPRAAAQTNDVARTSLKAFQDEAKHAYTGEEALDLCRRAFQARRLDFLQACFDGGLIVPFCKLLKSEKDPSIRYSAVLVMLKESPERWSDAGPTTIVNLSAGQHRILGDVCIEAMKGYFPENGISYQLFDTRSGRLELAKMFEEKLNSAGIKLLKDVN